MTAVREPKADFALLGHLDTWPRIFRLLEDLRGPGYPPLDERSARESFPWIPPRILSRHTVHSATGKSVRGVYVETFIEPDGLARPRESLAKVRAAAACAVSSGAGIGVLGGFTSIALEGDPGPLDSLGTTRFTTGNTLACAYIVKGVEKALKACGKETADCRILIVGAGGDLGQGCAGYFAARSAHLSLFGRNPGRLRSQAGKLGLGARCRWSTKLEELLPQADAVILVASVAGPAFDLSGCRRATVICDAGYPSNLAGAAPDSIVFQGGMGKITAGVCRDPDGLSADEALPAGGPVHGCLLEGILLAFENRLESYSQGRGNITPSRIEEIWELAQKHGLELSMLPTLKENP